MQVVEIFSSIEGEGKRAGLPATFIRLRGCNLECKYCDSKYATEKAEFDETLSIKEIMKIVDDIGIPNVTVTGGEPLIHPGIENLLIELVNKRYWVNVETNGTIVPTVRNKNIFYTMDYKTYASDMSSQMNMDAIHSLTSVDVLKFVVGAKEDLDQSLGIIESLNLGNAPQVFFSPVFGSIEPQIIVHYMLEHKLHGCKVQLQLHKYIWEPDMRGV